MADLIAIIRGADGDGYRPRRDIADALVAKLAWREPPDCDHLEAYWHTEFPRCAVEMAGAGALLGKLRARGLRLGIVTNGAVATQSTKVDVLGLGHLVDTVVVSEGVGLRKPDRAIFHLATSRLGVEPADAWFVGDHPPNDVIGAAEAGLTPIWLRRSHPWPANLDLPRWAIDTLAEILRILPPAADFKSSIEVE